MPGTRIVDLFAGCGGWSEGLRMIGLADVGLELEPIACRSRVAAGHPTIRADVATYPAERFRGADGLIASPPCQDFSNNGTRLGRRGARGELIDVVPRWVEVARPRWVACEQVPPCVEIWAEHAAYYRTLGYSAWTGVLNAADYGVPQTRQRAFLMASLDRPALPPEPTHGRHPSPSLFGPHLEPWVSMADVLGVDDDRSVNTGRDGKPGGTRAENQTITVDRPAPTLTGKSGGQWQWSTAERFEVTEALTLQSFRTDYPLAGSRTSQFQQIGNAVPPVLAARVIAAISH